MDVGFLTWAIDNLGGTLLVIVLGAMVFNRFLRHLDEQSENERARQMSWDAIRKSDNEAWLSLVAGHKVAIEALGLGVAELHRTIKEDKVSMIAYQNTSTSALTELVVNVQKLAGLPAGVRAANDAISELGKGQRLMIEGDSRTELEHKRDMAKINTALAEMQSEIKKMATAMERLPNEMQATIAPLVGMMNVVISTAQATQARLDDMPLGLGLVENGLLQEKPHPLTPLVSDMVTGGGDGTA